MATRQQRIRNLQLRGSEYFEAARQALRKIKKSGGTRGYFPERFGPGGSRTGPVPTGRFAFDTQIGDEPTDAEVQEFIDYTGGNRYAERAGELSTATPTKGGASNITRSLNKQLEKAGGQGDLMRRFLDDLVAKDAESNAANEARLRYIMDSGEALRTNRQGLAEGFGVAALGDIEEQRKRAIDEVLAHQNSIGNANSNVVDAFRVEAAIKAAREQGRVREDVARVKAGMLAEDTDRLTGAAERVQDIGPDFSDYQDLMFRAGASGSAQGYGGAQAGVEGVGGGYTGMRSSVTEPKRPKKRRRYAMPAGGGGVSPMALASMQAGVAGAYAPAMGLLNPVVPQTITSNRYATPRGSRTGGSVSQAALKRRLDKLARRDARLRKQGPLPKDVVTPPARPIPNWFVV